MRIPLQNEPDQGINLTPLIDVVFLLIIFFVVSTTYLREERELEVEIPITRHVEQLLSASSRVTVNVARDGRYLVQGREYGDGELESFLLAIAGRNPAAEIEINADRLVPLHRATRAIDLVRAAKLREYLLVEREPE